jgi:hypothetical protein
MEKKVILTPPPPQRGDKSRYGRADDTLGTPQIEANKQPVQGVSLSTEYQSFMSLSGLDFFYSVSTKYMYRGTSTVIDGKPAAK